jgi:hypothetical protein
VHLRLDTRYLATRSVVNLGGDMAAVHGKIEPGFRRTAGST